MKPDCPEGVREVFRKLWDASLDGDSELDFCDVQDWFEEAGIVTREECDPSTNEWDADWLYVLKPDVKAWLKDAPSQETAE